MIIKRILVLMFCFYGSIFNRINAQDNNPVKWTYSVKKISNKEALLIFDAKINPRWHLYAQNFGDGGPVRMSFNFKESVDYRVIGKMAEFPKPKVERDEIFEMEVQYFESRATLSQRIQLISDKNFIVSGTFEYQVCLDDKCVIFNPEFEFEIKNSNKI
jgi:hypothetical protein